MRPALFQSVRQQYGFRCGYCGVTETDSGATLTIDHFQPRSHNGLNVFSNLVYSCHACNEHKNDYWNPDDVERILHPLKDDLTTHYVLNDHDLLEARTDTGSFHIQRLQLNRPALIAFRRQRRETQQDREERAEMLTLMRQVSTSIFALTNAIEELRAGGE